MIRARFSRTLLESQRVLEQTIEAMQDMKRLSEQVRPWNKIPTGYRLRKKRRALRKLKERCARYFYKKPKVKHPVLASFRRSTELDLRGYFEILPPKSLTEHFTRIYTIKYIPKSKSPPAF